MQITTLQYVQYSYTGTRTIKYINKSYKFLIFFFVFYFRKAKIVVTTFIIIIIPFVCTWERNRSRSTPNGRYELRKKKTN